MDIVVKLPDKDYQVMLTKVMLACHGCEIIELPKGHGRLIDADAVLVEPFGNTYKDIDTAETIVEADRSDT